MRMIPIALLLVAGCSKTTEPDPEPQVAPPVTDTGDTGTTVTGFVPDFFTIYAFFGVDDTGHLHEWTEGGDLVLPQVHIAIYENLDTPPCDVTFFMDNPNAVALQPWSFTDETPDIAVSLMEHVGFDIPDNALVQTDGCLDWNTGVYGDVATVVASKHWGVGIGTLRSDIEQVVIDDGDWLNDMLDASTLVGASWKSDLWQPNTWASHTAYAGSAPGWVLDTDAKGVPTAPLTQAQILGTPGSLAEGVYIVQPVFLWDWSAYF